MSLIDPADLIIEALIPPRGGQHVGTWTGVRVTHERAGIMVEVKTDRSQHRNKALAVEMIEAALTSQHFRGYP